MCNPFLKKQTNIPLKDYQSLASLRESDPPSDASDATLFASMAEPIPEMAAEPLPGRPRFSRTIHGNFCERKFLSNPLIANDCFSFVQHFFSPKIQIQFTLI